MTRLPSVAILAGGLGTRLGPLTQALPKALVEVNGEPFIAHQIAELRRQGVTDVVCCVGHHGELIEKTMGDGKNVGVRIKYSYDGDRLLGTGGALKKAARMLGETFFVLYGDSYLRVNYRDVHTRFIECGKQGLLTVFQNDGRWDTSNVVYLNHRVVTYSKSRSVAEMRYIDYGLGLLWAEVFDEYADDDVFDLSRVYETLADRDELAGFEVTERFYEIGSLDGLASLEAFLASGQRGRESVDGVFATEDEGK